MRIDIKQLEVLHHKLRTMLLWLEEETGFESTETSSRRIGDSGVHGTDPTRGYDLRCRDEMVGKAIETFINDNWEYDPSRKDKKCAKLHGVGSALHLHLQVHPSTKVRV